MVKVKKVKWYGMNQCNNRIWLKRMLKHFSLTRQAVANLLIINISTVDRWLVPEGSTSHRKMSPMARKLLTYMIEHGEIKVDITANGS